MTDWPSCWWSNTRAWHWNSPTRAVVLDRGRLVHAGDSRTLIADPDRLAELIGVA